MASSSANGLSLQFKPPDIAAPSLQQQIQLLLQQRGALRHITNHSLQAEIEQPEAAEENGQDDKSRVDDDSDHEKPQARQERLWKAREEMLQKLAYAQNEILSALDFVSLLLSGGSVAAQSSMSPALKQHVPIGTIEGQAVERQEVSKASRQRLTQVSEGWKSESFKSASTKLKQAASRLESEAQRQSKYWDQIASLKLQGWSTSRLPSDSRAIGVHYGFSEAAPQFRNRGFALLQQDEQGSLQLDQRSHNTSMTYSMLRVDIVRGGTVTGSSRLLSSSDEQVNSINDQVKEARDRMFEEELFHELSREARVIANQGARTQANAVAANIDSHTQIRIVQTDRTDSQSMQDRTVDDQLADSIALDLRLLLLLEHSKAKQSRSKPPAVMSHTPQMRPEYALLRPVLAHLRHEATLATLRSTCQSFASTFTKAGLRFTFKLGEVEEGSETMDMQHLRRPVRSHLEVQVQSGKKIELDIETYLGSPLYGTVFRSQRLDFGFVDFQAGTFHALDEAEHYLSHAITLDLMAQASEFEVLKPHSGEMALKANEKVKAIINVRPQRVSLVVDNTGRKVYSWRPSGFQSTPSSEGGASRTFKEVVKSLGK